jgi:hypothetical protein
VPAPTDLTLGEKLDQRRFSAMSNKMAALVRYTLGKQTNFTVEPEIVWLSITADGFVIASNDDMTSTIIGSADDFFANWDRLIEAAELTPDEELDIRGRLATIRDHRAKQEVQL